MNRRYMLLTSIIDSRFMLWSSGLWDHVRGCRACVGQQEAGKDSDISQMSLSHTPTCLMGLWFFTWILIKYLNPTEFYSGHTDLRTEFQCVIITYACICSILSQVLVNIIVLMSPVFFTRLVVKVYFIECRRN